MTKATTIESDYQKELRCALQALGNAAEMSNWAFSAVATELESHGVPVIDLTVGELLDAVGLPANPSSPRI